ncbi:carboxyl transferase domain-containing protein [Paraburkholderia sp. GAS334]|uniref:carboxyl transferase domain-containing protein n=1 Tax=Paraburkholderia sp. GAS334 TaxID=3035131 RepID=UPI003D1C9812
MNSPQTPLPVASEWVDDLHELAQRRAIARELGGDEQVARHHAQGKLTARERIDHLLDPGSFAEIGMLAGTVKYDADRKREHFTPSNAVVGIGKIDARRTVVAADDFTIRAGSSERSVSEKWIYADRCAWEYKLPLVRMVDSAGGSVKHRHQSSRVPPIVDRHKPATSGRSRSCNG